MLLKVLVARLYKQGSMLKTTQ